MTVPMTDAELDRLLGLVAAPPAPAADLADRIVARSLGTPRSRVSRLTTPRRLRVRRHPFIWSAMIAANALAAAAAASTWDGQRFDFHRLADLPHRVAVTLHLPEQHHERHQLAQIHRRPTTHPLKVAPMASRPASVEPSQHELATSEQVAPPTPVRPPVVLPNRTELIGIRHHLASSEIAGERMPHTIAPRIGPKRHLKLRALRLARARPMALPEPRINPAPHAEVVRVPESRPERAWEKSANGVLVDRSAEPRTFDGNVRAEGTNLEAPPVRQQWERAPGTRPGGPRRKWGQGFFRRWHPMARGNRFRRGF